MQDILFLNHCICSAATLVKVKDLNTFSTTAKKTSYFCLYGPSRRLQGVIVTHSEETERKDR